MGTVTSKLVRNIILVCFLLHGCIGILLCQFNKIGHFVFILSFFFSLFFLKKMYAVTPCLVVVLFSDYGLMEHAPATIMEC